MCNFDGSTIEITNWDKYNPRKDLKATSWVRLQNSLFEDPSFIEFNKSELLFWVYLLSMASKKQSGIIKFSLTHALRIGRFTPDEITEAIAKLTEMDCVRVTEASRTRTLHARNVDDTLRDERNETNVTNETNTFAGNSSGEIGSPDLEESEENQNPAIEGKQTLEQLSSKLNLLPPSPHPHKKTIPDYPIRIVEIEQIDPTLEELPPPIEKKRQFDFDVIYREYPRKDGKNEGLKICKARIKSEDDYDNLLAAVRRYRAHCEREGIEKQFIKHFSSFMNKDRWKDWLEPDTGTAIEAAPGSHYDMSRFT